MLILGNGRMITRDADNPYLECGAVVIDGTKIVKAGTLSEVKAAYPDAEFLDAKGKVIMPAFINAHEHIYSAFARGLSVKGYDPKGFLDILDGMWWTIDRNLTLHDTYLSAMATYIDSIKNGVTTVFFIIRELIRTTFYTNIFQFFAYIETAFEHSTRYHIFQFGTHNRIALTRFYM